jgi:hypothetical protein
MKKGVIDKAERLALNEFDKWNDITGFVSEYTSYYYEMQSLIEDAVHIGIQMASNGKVQYDEFGNVKRED